MVAVGAQPLAYLWVKNGAYINEADSVANLTFASLGEADEGTYSVVVYNRLGTAQSRNVSVTVGNLPAVLQPAAAVTVEADPGQDAVFGCVADGTGALSFSWAISPPGQLNASAAAPVPLTRGRTVAGASWGNLTLSGVSNADEALYYCNASSRLGWTLGPPMRLSVADPPSIVSDPQDAFVDPGHEALLAVGAAGASPLTYQYQWCSGRVSWPTAAHEIHT